MLPSERDPSARSFLGGYRFRAAPPSAVHGWFLLRVSLST